MTWALCFKCGDIKHGAFSRCERCDTLPRSDDELMRSLAFSDHYFSAATLGQIGQSIKEGRVPELPKEIRNKLRPAVAEAKRIMGIANHGSRPKASTQKRSSLRKFFENIARLFARTRSHVPRETPIDVPPTLQTASKHNITSKDVAFQRAPIWPVVIAPIVVGIYYMVVQSAVEEAVIGNFNNKISPLYLWSNSGPTYGSHWFYHLITAILLVWFATFVAAGIARGRERAAAFTGGITIATAIVVFWGSFLFFRRAYTVGLEDLDPVDYLVPDPWYQYAIGVLVGISAPIIALFAWVPARTLNEKRPTGFGGVNRMHFIWLPIAAHWYALGLISPVWHLLTLPRDASDLLTGVFTSLPTSGVLVMALIVPGFYGLALLSGHNGHDLNPTMRNILGVLVLIFGFLLGVFIQVVVTSIVQWLFG